MFDTFDCFYCECPRKVCAATAIFCTSSFVSVNNLVLLPNLDKFKMFSSQHVRHIEASDRFAQNYDEERLLAAAAAVVARI